ncbi:MAG: hypothetical protein EXS03_09295 [Phycisphaerales bacterium]|nr:hypothetical protein [Phycisphaerales bacterium]
MKNLLVGTAIAVCAMAALTGAISLQSAPAYEYGRLVFTVGGSGTSVWLNTPSNAVTATVGRDSGGQLTAVAGAIQATAPDATFASGVPIDDMMLVNWMGVARWELVAVTQTQVEIGVATSYYYKRRK